MMLFIILMKKKEERSRVFPYFQILLYKLDQKLSYVGLSSFEFTILGKRNTS